MVDDDEFARFQPLPPFDPERDYMVASGPPQVRSPSPALPASAIQVTPPKDMPAKRTVELWLA